LLDENRDNDRKRQVSKTQLIIAWTKTLYKEKPRVFAFGVIGVSALSLMLGALLLGGIHSPFLWLEP
jgi:hypothetical protein